MKELIIMKKKQNNKELIKELKKELATLEKGSFLYIYEKNEIKRLEKLSKKKEKK
jgi:hypothetical protein